MNWQGSHLSDRQIEEYVSESSAERSSFANEYAHITACDLCQRRVLEAERAHLGILQRDPAKRPFPECPDEETLQKYAAGLCATDEAAKIFHHAARCDFCAPLLKTYMEDLSGDLPAEANDFLRRLPASQTEWGKLVREHARPRPRLLDWLRKRFFLFQTPGLAWRTAAVAGGLALAAFAVVSLRAALDLRRAEKSIAKAFTEHPDTNFRFALSPPKWDTKLNEEGTPASSSGTLRAVVTPAYEHQDSSDPKWLRINGRLRLLSNDVKDVNAANEAVDFLQAAYDKGLNDPGTQIDLAAAYFLRAKTKGPTDLQDVSRTVDWLNKARKEPELTPDEQRAALFDLALAYEAMLQWDLAVQAWKDYLTIDSEGGPWREAAEGRKREDESQIRPPRPEGYKGPAYFEDHSSDRDVQDSIEEYQDAALKTWLTGYREGGAGAVHALADVLEEQHGDPWLKDFLSRRQPGDSQAIQALGAAIAKNRKGAYKDAEHDAETAEGIFEQTGNAPGVLRSKFEVMYANQRNMDSADCVEQAQSLETALRETAYRWLQIQVALTQASCLNRNEDFWAADDKLAIGAQNAERFKFHILQLRAKMLDAGMKAARVDCDGSFRAATAGLNLYWQGPSSPFWLYQLYSTMKQCLEKQRKWHAEVALERRMIAILEREISPEDKDSNFEDNAHLALQLILTALGESPEATANPRPDPQSATSRLPIDIQRAALQLEVQGNAQLALDTLDKAQGLVAATKDHLIQLDFYTVQGNVLLKLQKLGDAEAAYSTAIQLAEQARARDPLKWRNKTDEIYRGLVGVFLGLGQSDLALRLWEWHLARPWVSDRPDETPPRKVSWPEIESEVRAVSISGSAVDTRLIYAFIKDNLYIWTISPAGVSTLRVVPVTQEELEHRISDYAQEIGDEHSNIAGLERDSERLYELLLQPVISELTGDGIVVVESDPLMNGLPLEALRSPEGWYFGQRYPVVYSPGMIKDLDLRPVPNRPPTANWLLNALNTDHQGLADLPGTKVVNALEVTPDKLSNHLRESEMFIFWGHGKSGTLRMPNRSRLQAEDFPPDSLQKLQLAALIACSSGSGGDSLLDTSNLVHAMLSGGVPEVIASRWDVSRDRSRQLLVSFYNHLMKGETAARSMLEARQEVFRRGNYHPYYWAAFTLTGRAR